MLSIPYGISNFQTIRDDGMLFIDRTAYIRAIEAADRNLLFLRPRRFGKSLWLSILEHYYDVRHAERFDALFGGLDIGRTPTPLRNTFLVLRLDFSSIDTSGDDERLRETLTWRTRGHVQMFIEDHRPWLSRVDESLAALARVGDPPDALRVALVAARVAGLPLYVLIDEYDNFTNELIATRQEERYKHLVTGTGLLKTFFKGIKEATGLGSVARTFTTGVNPLLLDDLTSGFNIATNLSLEPEFAGMLGFTAAETHALIELAVAEAPAGSALPPASEVVDLARAFYDGYRFHPEAEALYNPDMALYLLGALAKGRLPSELLDQNLRTDIGKLDLVVRKAGDFASLWAVVEGGGNVAARPVTAFGVNQLAERRNFLSLLYYLGMLTFAEGAGAGLRVPNYVIRTLYWTQVQRLAAQTLSFDGVDAVATALSDMMGAGEAEPFFRLMLDQVIREASNRDLIHFNEAAIKTLALAFLTLSPDIAIFSEWETGGGYADLVIVPQPAVHWLKRAWMIELKYLKQKDDTPAARERLLAEGQAQLHTYLQDERRMRYLGRYDLRTAVALFIDADELVWQAGPRAV